MTDEKYCCKEFKEQYEENNNVSHYSGVFFETYRKESDDKWFLEFAHEDTTDPNVRIFYCPWCGVRLLQ
jgi:hypothetical protein